VSAFRRFVARVRELLTGTRVDREMREEIDHHLRLATEEHLRRGLPPDEARAAARRGLGGVDQTLEAVRDRRGFAPVSTTLREITHAARALAAAPGFTSAAVLTLALGIGVNAAIFAMVDAVMLQPLPYPDPGRLVSVWETMPPRRDPAATPQRIAVAPANLADYQRDAGEAIALAAYSPAARSLTQAGEPARLGAEEVSVEYFSVLGVSPAIGRTFRPDEMTPGRDLVAIITDRLWRSHFGADPSVLGRMVRLDGRPTEIVGVMPPEFEAVTDYRSPVDVLVPAAFPPDMLTGRGEHVLYAFGRLAPGVTADAARDRLRQVAGAIAASDPIAAGLGVSLAPLGDDQVREAGVGPLFVILLVAVSLVLIIACANIANLLVVRSMARRREIAVRSALGASRSRLVLHVAAESLVLAALGAALGVVLGAVTAAVLASLAPSTLPRIGEVAVGGRTVAFAGLLACGAALLFGLLPALQVSRADPSDVLQTTGRSVVGGWVRRSRAVLLVAEVALSVVLLVAAVLMSRSLARLNAVDLGFNPANVLAVEVALPRARYATPDARLAFFESVEAALASQPGVRSVAFGNRLPLRGNWESGLELEGADAATPAISGYQAVNPGYRETFGIPLRRGRWIEPGDRTGAQPVAVVNEAFGRELLGGADPLGRRLRRTDRDPWVTIVGVVGDIRRGGRLADTGPQVYVPAAQTWQYPLHLSDLAIRTTGDPAALGPAVRAAIWARDADQPLTRIATLDDVLRLGQATREFRTWLFLLFAALALALSIVGVYGVVSYAVSQRTPEIGLRMALGAAAPRVLGWVVRQAAWPVAAGAAIGLGAAWWLSRYVATLLFQVEPTDAASYVLASAIVVGVAAAASLVAGRRATRVDPATVLR
jgi:predicted permease